MVLRKNKTASFSRNTWQAIQVEQKKNKRLGVSADGDSRMSAGSTRYAERVKLWYGINMLKFGGAAVKRKTKQRSTKKKKANPGILSPDGQINLLDVKCNWRKREKKELGDNV